MTERDSGFRRIVVALDASHASRAVLGAAAALAARFRAELVGLFIEDVNLLHMGALPFTRVAGAGPLSSEVDHAMLERALRRAAAETRATLAHLAEGGAVRWSFTVVRGRLAREIIAATGPSDLVIVEETALGRVVRPALARAAASVLCLRADSGGARGVLVGWRAGKEGRRVLAAAAGLALATKRALTVLLPADEAAAEGARAEVEEVFSGLGLELRLRRLSAAEATLGAAARRSPGAIVVWTAAVLETEEGSGGELEAVLEIARCSVLLVR
jgi:nucleotide-binding universal stress UspA family protein